VNIEECRDQDPGHSP